MYKQSETAYQVLDKSIAKVQFTTVKGSYTSTSLMRLIRIFEAPGILFVLSFIPLRFYRVSMSSLGLIGVGIRFKEGERSRMMSSSTQVAPRATYKQVGEATYMEKLLVSGTWMRERRLLAVE